MSTLAAIISSPKRLTVKRGGDGKGTAARKVSMETVTAALRHGVELPGKLFGSYELKRRGQRIELEGREKLRASARES